MAHALGLYPVRRHDSSDWKPSDAKRRNLSGKEMIKGACLYIKGDWCEYAATWGFPTWRDALRPCFECNAFGLDMYCCAGNSFHELRWGTNDDHDYERACATCEILVRLTDQASYIYIYIYIFLWSL